MKKPKITGYAKTLTKLYEEEPIVLNMKNKFGNNFVVFPKDLEKDLKKLDNSIYEVAKYQDVIKGSKINKFLINEINASLKIENVDSTRRLTQLVLEQKAKESFEVNKEDQIELLISNMSNALNYIMATPIINTHTMFSLYSTLTWNVKMKGSRLTKDSFYRDNAVYIGGHEALKYQKIETYMNDLFKFIKSDVLNNHKHLKAIIVHYVFEHIHPYFDFNGRSGRLLHLWTLKAIDPNFYLTNLYFADAIYNLRSEYYKAFQAMNFFKEDNINLNIWAKALIDIFTTYNLSFVAMAKAYNDSTIKLSDKTLIFIHHIIMQSINKAKKWFTIKDLKLIFPDYSSTVYGRILIALEKSKLVEVRTGMPKEYSVKNKYIPKI